jgi:hypothetical protein
MAIDPSIALDIKPYQGPSMNDYASMAGTMQNIKQSQATTANLQAANPGIQAQSQVSQQAAVNAQRQGQAQQLTPQIMQDNMKTNPDGTQTLDVVGAANAFASAGLPDQAHNILKPYMDSVSQNQDIVKQLQGNTGDLQKLQLQVAGPILNIAAREPDPAKRAQMLDSSLAGAEAAYPNLFPKGSTTEMEALFNRAKVDPDGAAAYSTDPVAWTKLGLDQKNAETARIGAEVSAFNAKTADLSQRIGVAGSVNLLNNSASTYNDGATAVDQLRDPQTGKLPQGVQAMVGSALQGTIDTDPRYASVKNAIAQAVKDGHTIDYTQGLESVQNQLKLFRNQTTSAIGMLTQTQGAAGRPVPPVAPAAPTVTPPGNAGPQAQNAPAPVAPPGKRLVGREFYPQDVQAIMKAYKVSQAEALARIKAEGGTIVTPMPTTGLGPPKAQ